MAGTKRKTSKKTSQSAQKTLNLSPSIFLILLILLAGFIYAIYLENGDIETPSAVTENFITKDADLEIHFIDVGQGDSSLIIFGDTTILVDAGEKEMGERVVKYLDDLGIKKLDYIVATHPHSDHIGGLPFVINNIDAGKVIAPRITEEITPTTKTYENFLLALKGKALKLTAAKSGDIYTLEHDKQSDADGGKAKTAQLEIISPIYPDYEAYTDLNDFSVVFKLSYKNTSYLFTGDASKPVEKDILSHNIDISADVLKVPHHGSSSSSSSDYVKAISAKYGIIQCGQDNSYNHPNEKIVARYEKTGITLYRNDLNGNVVVYSDGDEIKIQAQNKPYISKDEIINKDE